MSQNKIPIITSLIILSIWLVLFAFRLIGSGIDYDRVNKGLEPLFTYDEVAYKDGGSIKYIGFGYSIMKLNRFYIADDQPAGREKGAILNYRLNWLFFKMNTKKQTYVVHEETQ